MPENLHHEKIQRKTKRNGIFIGGYVKDSVAEFVRAQAKAENATLSKYLNTHFQELSNAEKLKKDQTK